MNIDEILSGARQGILDRLSSPFWGSFLISWSIINYEAYLILFSDNSVTTTLALMDTLVFTDAQTIMLNCLLAPLAASLSYIYLYPYPARKFFEYMLKQQLAQNKIKQDLEKTELLTQEKSNKLRVYYAEQKADYEKEIEMLTQENQALVEKMKNLLSKPSEIDIKDLGHTTATNGSPELSSLEYEILSALADIAEITGEQDGEDATRDILSTSYLAGKKSIDLDHAIGKLIEKNLLNPAAYSRNRRLKFTQAGRDAYITHREQIENRDN